MMDEAWVRTMERRMATVEAFVKEIRENHLPHIDTQLDTISSRLNRPTWSVVALITFLTSISCGLLTAIVIVLGT